MRVLVLGSSGMVGKSLAKQLKLFKKIDVVTASRGADSPDVVFKHLSDLYDHLRSSQYRYVVNCVGLLRSKSGIGTLDFNFVNGAFPQALGSHLSSFQPKCQFIQVSSDGVFSPINLPKREETIPTPNDVYGKSKVLGEKLPGNSLIVRAAITGESLLNSNSLVSRIKNGYDLNSLTLFPHHTWNGISVESFSRVVQGIILNSLDISGIRHLVPSDVINKQELVKFLFELYGRKFPSLGNQIDLSVKHFELETSYPNWISDAWKMAGYKQVPSVFESLTELTISAA
jgi:dTDP-4-dehydrorhamnose reductase